MPSPCPHFKLLHDRVNSLSLKFVDDQAAAEAADPAGFQPDLDRLAAYRLLVHAELEDFLEAKAKQNISSIATKSTGTSLWMRQAPELLPIAIALKKGMPMLESLEASKFSTFVGELVTGALAAISDNNGVKAQSFALLSVCSGKTIDEIDPILSASLNSYGKERGDVAHKSVTHTTTLKAPSTELATARSLVAEMGKFFDVTV
jgi:hypothetical protein